MLQVNVYREVTDDAGTFGTLRVESADGFRCRTGELPWRNNEHRVSCPPAGTYKATVRWSEHFKRDLYHIDGVPEREAIEIHPGNFVGDVSKGFHTDSHGCLILGFSVGDVMRSDKVFQKGVAQSLHALEQFMKATQEQPIEITFHWTIQSPEGRAQ